ncbi:MAG: PQQ-binding-like beta-propeller repeat protein, partial [Planctomycetes bacterium]|nr:PQQ-binding-like beta-propeller repeat protein [Planctomycetota bacterium]
LLDELKRAGRAAAPPAGLAAELCRSAADELASQRRRLAVRTAAGLAAAAAMVLTVWWLSTSGGPFWRPASRGAAVSAAAAGAGRPADVWHFGGALALPASSAVDGIVVRDKSMYFLHGGADGRHVAAVDISTGRRRWESSQRSIGYLAADGSRIYCLAARGPGRIDLLALDGRTGSLRWRISRPRSDRLVAPCRPVPVGDDRLAWVSGGEVHFIEASTGRLLWDRPVTGGGPLSCVVGDGERLFVAGPNSLHCLDAASGRPLWTLAVSPGSTGPHRPLLALAGGAVYVVHDAGSGGMLRCIDLATRQVLWHKETGQVRHILACGGGVFLRGADVRAYDGRTGRPLWRRRAGGCSPPTAHGGLLYLIDSRRAGRLLALDQHTGAKVWELAGIRSCDAFRRVGRTGFVKTQDGVIHAIALRDP